MSRYAVVNGSGLVINVVQWDGSSSWTAPVNCTAIQSDTAGIGYTYSGGIFTPPTPPTPPTPTPAQQAQAALTAGINLTSTSTPSLNGTYSINTTAIANINSIETYILKNSAFPGSLAVLPWADRTGTMHTFPSTTLFSQFATEVANYVTLVTLYGDSNGSYGSLPSPNITIS